MPCLYYYSPQTQKSQLHLHNRQMESYDHFPMGTYGGGDLEAVVRSCTSSTSIENFENTFSINQNHEFVSDSYTETLFERDMFFDELEALYKPFYPTMKLYSSSSASLCSEEIEQQEEKPYIASGSPIVCANHEATKYKRRKNQQKRVVMQVKEENLSSDKWAWRKYGQKPIKGSPYPRSYYRCSSSKGCIARKQVERSLSDPQNFIITYTAEHCHPLPTRRNSLAGTTRNKFPKCPSNTTTVISEPSDDTSSLPPNTNVCSLYNSPMEITSQQEITKSEKEEWEQFEEMVLRDDFDEMGNVNYDMLESINWFDIQ